MQRLAGVALGAAIFLAACSSGGEDGTSPTPTVADSTPGATATAAPAGVTITSDDGRLTLFIPDGATPNGEQVTITDVPRADLPGELQELIASGDGYRLEPDGLEFLTPVTATLTVDRNELDDSEDGTAAYVLASFSDTFGREALDSETAYTLGDDTVQVTSGLEHLSWITRTRGSLFVTILAVGARQLVARQFTVTYAAHNSNPAEFIIRGGTLFLDHGGPVHIPQAMSLDLLPLDELSPTATGRFDASCVRPGLGSYGVTVSGFSRSLENADASTRLDVSVVRVIECVEPGSESAEIGLSLGCRHIGPGESDLLANVIVRGPDGEALVGVLVELAAEGPDGYQMVAEATTDANGRASLSFPITRTGGYAVKAISARSDVDLLRLVGSNEGPLDFVVGEVCTPPP